jgi:lysophospholipase L1-like esterase
MKNHMRSTLINLALFITSTLLALLMIELALRLTGRDPLYVSPERERFWKYDPLLGWAHQPGQEGIFETPQFRTTVQINQKGLRDRDHSYERANDVRRILVLGDSFAWGYGVEEAERFSQLLESMMDVEVVNAGVSGYSTDQELLWLQNEGIKYDPDLIILVFAGNDIGDNEQQLVNTIYFKPQFVIAEDQLILKNTPVPKTTPQGKVIYDLSQRSSLFYFLVQRYFDLLSVYNDIKADSDNPGPLVSGVSSEGEPFRVTMTLLHEISETAESKEASLMIVATDQWWNSSSEETYTDFIEALHFEGFFVLDVEAMPGFDPAEMLIQDDGHWSQAGHEFVAEKIWEFIENNQLLTQPTH